ncbi:MAG: exo-alpha-sialidase [Actinobacteria bacterium]|nr:exo-alpha-sialidase [Actinomycetota bacterium]
MNLTRGLSAAAVVIAFAACLNPAAHAANLPGDPCSTAGQVVALGAGSIECVGGTWQPSSKQPGTGGPSGAGAGTSIVASLHNFTTVGPVLTQTTFGSSGRQVADPSALRLANGRIRVFSWVNPVGIRSATSTNAAGTTFVVDTSIPIPWTMGGQPRIVRVDAKTVRLFYAAGGNINAAVSADEGLTFTDEGPVITTAQAGFEPGTLSLVKQKGQYRAYFSNLEKPGERTTRIMRTATSTDMLHWTMGPTLTTEGSHPFALIDKAGKIAIYYAADRGSSYGLFVSTSRNGISFSKEKLVIAGAADADIIAAGKAKWLMYYGTEVSTDIGFGVFLARSRGNAIP